MGLFIGQQVVQLRQIVGIQEYPVIRKDERGYLINITHFDEVFGGMFVSLCSQRIWIEKEDYRIAGVVTYDSTLVCFVKKIARRLFPIRI